MNILALFGISMLMSFVSSGVIAQLYAWPRLRTMNHDQALLVLVAPHMFLRFIGLSFFCTGGCLSVAASGLRRPRRVRRFCRWHPRRRRDGRALTSHIVGHGTRMAV